MLYKVYLMINGLFWNIRGIAKPPNLRRLKRLIRLHDFKFVAICEPKMDVSQIDSIKIRLPFDSVVVNSSTDIWVFYNTPLVCAVLGNSSQHITISVQHPWLARSLCFSFVHAKCTLEERRTM